MNRKGQALVEFVLILPVFILILFAVIDFGVILNKKNELENSSTDIVMLYKSNVSLEDIKNKYNDLNINISENNNYITIAISENINIMTPGLNLALGNPYKVIVERTIPNV